jgi:hypothetical protein
MKKHLLLWFNDLGSAYVAANEAAKLGAKILEVYPFGSKGHLLFEAQEAFARDSFVGSLESKPLKHQEFKKLEETVLPAYLSLINPPLHDHILIVESDFLGDIFTDCLKAVELGLAILDLRFVRDSSGHSYAILTGRIDMCETLAKQTKCKAKLVDRPHPGLKEFFPA